MLHETQVPNQFKQPTPEAIPTRRLGTVRQMAEAYPAFTQSGLRWLVFNEKTNGFGVCVRRVGKKVIIDWDRFEDFIG